MTRLMLAVMMAGAASLAGSPGPQQSAPPLIGTANLSGIVVADDGGQPLAGALVTLNTAAAPQRTLRKVLTDSAGAFSFPQIPADAYIVSASLPGFLPTRYGQKNPNRPGTPVAVVDHQALAAVTVRLFRGAVIAGRVTGQNNQPLVGALVRLYAAIYRPDGRGLEERYGVVKSDDRGDYRFYDLPPGEYAVRVAPANTDVTAITDVSLDGVQPAPALGYAPEFYPGVESASAAAPIVVAVGEDHEGVNIPLAPVALQHVRGRLVVDGRVPGTLFSEVDESGLILEDQPLYGATRSADGHFVIANVTPGMHTYRVRSTQSSVAGDAPIVGGSTAGRLWGTSHVSVDNRDVSDVEIAMQPGVTISGELRFDGKAAALDPQKGVVSFELQPVGPGAMSQGERLMTRLDGDGHFSIQSVPPGSYQPLLPFGPWSVASIVSNGRDVSSMPIAVDAADVSGIIITLTDRPSSLAGTLSGPSGAALTEFTIVAFRKDALAPTSHLGAVYAARPSTVGQFVIPRLLPGDYLIAVTDDIEPNSWFDPRVLETLSKGAVPVTIAAGEAKTQSLRVGSGK